MARGPPRPGGRVPAHRDGRTRRAPARRRVVHGGRRQVGAPRDDARDRLRPGRAGGGRDPRCRPLPHARARRPVRRRTGIALAPARRAANDEYRSDHRCGRRGHRCRDRRTARCLARVRGPRGGDRGVQPAAPHGAPARVRQLPGPTRRGERDVQRRGRARHVRGARAREPAARLDRTPGRARRRRRHLRGRHPGDRQRADRHGRTRSGGAGRSGHDRAGAPCRRSSRRAPARRPIGAGRRCRRRRSSAAC